MAGAEFTSETFESLERVVRENAVAGYLIEVSTATDNVYKKFLAAARKRVGESFAPWDAPFVLARLTEEFAEATVGIYPNTGLEKNLRAALIDCGFQDEERSLYFANEDTNDATSANQFSPGIHVRVTRDERRRQFGTTQDFGAISIARCELNLVTDGIEAYRIAFHECGHAVHFTNICSKYQSLRLNMPVFFTEAIAQVFESLPIERPWLAKNRNLSTSKIDNIRFLRALQEIFSLRENIAFALVELLVTESVGDFEQLWPVFAQTCLYPEIELKDLLVPTDHTTRLVFYQHSALNVALAMCLAAQIRNHVANRPNATIYLPGMKAGMIGFMREGGSADWQDVMQRACGSPVDPETVGLDFETKLSKA